jgi:energy-coupling factor transport system ATP-binding protein
MEDISRVANRIIVVHQGSIELVCSKEEVFAHGDRLEAIGLGLPQILYLVKALREKGMDIDQGVINFDGVERMLIDRLGGLR